MSAGETPDSVKRERLIDHHMWWIIVLGICGMATYPIFKYQAFPSASLDLKLPRLEIQKQCEKLAPKFGFDKTDLIESTVFDFDNSEKIFLEHEYPQDKANALMSSSVPVWYWATRLCKQFDQEEFKTWIAPDGKLVAFSHEIPNDRKLTSVSHADAQKIARAYLESVEPEAAKYDVLVRDEASSKPKREDHSFTWEDQKTDYKKAQMRIDVYISGDQVTNYYKYLHVPDSWERNFATMRSYNNLLGSMAFFFIYIFQTTAFLIFVWGIVTKNVRWGPSIVGGVILGGIASLDYLNHAPTLIAGYSVTSSFNDYIIQVIRQALVGLLANAISSITLFGGAEIAYRWLFPKKISLEKLFTKVGLTSRQVVRGVIVGHFLVGVHLAYVVFYYLAGKSLNFWCPLAVENHQTLSNIVPFFSAMALGVSASFEEELACRVIGIAIGTKLFKRFWLANLFQAVVWGFAHSSYPQEPAFARGLELTIMGLLLGWLIRRFGLVACITEHYLLDAFMYSEALLYATEPALKLSVLPALMPVLLIVGLALLLNRGKNLQMAEELNNETIPIRIPEKSTVEEPVVQIHYNPLSRRLRVILSLVFVVSTAIALALPWSNGINTGLRINITRDQSLKLAEDVMRRHGVDPEGWMSTSSCSTNGVSDAFQYMYEKSDFKTTSTCYKDVRRGYLVSVRFFKPLQSAEYTVVLDGDGHELTFSIRKEELEKGAKLMTEAARQLADKYIDQVRPEFKDRQFKQISSQKRKNRTDYTVEYTVPRLKVAEADCRMEVQVIGDQVGNLNTWWDVPDSWQFERNKRGPKEEWCSHLQVAAMVLFIVLFLWWALSLLRTGAIRWRVPMALAAASCVLLILNQLNFLPSFYASYSNTTPMNNFLTQKFIGIGQSLFAGAVSTVLSAAIVLGAARIILPTTPPRPFLKLVFARDSHLSSDERKTKRDLWLDAVLISCFAIGFLVAVQQISSMVSLLVSPSVPSETYGVITSLFEVLFPLGFYGSSVLQAICAVFAGLVVGLGMLAKFAPGFWRMFFVLVIVTAISNSSDRYWQDFALTMAKSTVYILGCYLIIARLARNNLLTYVLMIAAMTGFSFVGSIFLNGTHLFLPEAIILTVLTLSPLLFVLWTWLGNRLAGGTGVTLEKQ